MRYSALPWLKGERSRDRVPQISHGVREGRGVVLSIPFSANHHLVSLDLCVVYPRLTLRRADSKKTDFGHVFVFVSLAPLAPLAPGESLLLHMHQ